MLPKDAALKANKQRKHSYRTRFISSNADKETEIQITVQLHKEIEQNSLHSNTIQFSQCILRSEREIERDTDQSQIEQIQL